MNFLSRFLRDRPALEAELDLALAARALARRRAQLGREPIKARARELRAALGLPELPALAPLESVSRRIPESMKADSE